LLAVYQTMAGASWRPRGWRPSRVVVTWAACPSCAPIERSRLTHHVRSPA